MEAVVIGINHHNTLGMVRSLGKKGVQVAVILVCAKKKDSYVLASRYVSKCFYATCAKDAISVLREHFPERTPVFACSDDVVALQNETAAHYMNKQVQVELAKKYGLPVPKSVVYVVGDKNLNVSWYPCIVKPLESIHGGKRFAICNNERELSATLCAYQIGDVVQIQQYIRKDYEIVVDGVSTKDGVIIPGYVRKHRDILGGTTFSTTYPIKNLQSEVCEKIKGMISGTGYLGLFGVELLISNNLCYFVEINLRSDATTYALTIAGINLPYVCLLAQKNMNYTCELDKEVRQINSIVEFRDIRFMLKGRVSPLRWYRELQESECRYFYDKDDEAPYRKARKQFLSSLLSKLIR